MNCTGSCARLLTAIKHMPTPLEVLKQYWGYEQFRPMQEDIIQSVLGGTDTLALMPTGGGKSICFQVPALCQEGICVVISPLIALMKDQVESLKKRGISAAAVYSGMNYRDIDRIFDNCVYGDIKFLYLSPERLLTDIAIERIPKMKVNLLAVDEAHCISQWGYDFRPPYLQIAQMRERLPQTPVLALTATATADVVTDIQEKLAFRKGKVFQKSFARDNLAYVVLHEEGKTQKLVEILQKVPGPGVVYARNRRKTKELALMLQQHGIRADYYHAGLTPQERSDKQDAWIHNHTRVIVSTNAFGMGIDKPDVRVVVHMDLPDSLEAYFQEAGRAGRDEKKAYAVLLYHVTDKINLEKQFELAFPSLQEIRQVYRALGSFYQLAIGSGQLESYDFDLLKFTETYKLDAAKTLSCLKVLEQAGWLSLSEAVYIPSTIRILVNKDELYDYQLKHPRLDRILKAVLRSYQGAFTGDISLREGQLANFLDIKVVDLSKALELMHKDGILHYVPQKDQPQLVFLQERVDASNMSIDHKMYEFRKKRQEARIKSAIAYAETPECRNRQLLAYFGEKDAPACGKCDVCLGRKQSTLSTLEFESYSGQILHILEEGPKTAEELINRIGSGKKEMVLQTLEYMVDEGVVEFEAGLFRLPV